MYRHRRCCKWLPPASIHSCARVIMLRYARCNTVILMAATAWLILSFSSCIVCGFDSYNVSPPRGGDIFSGDIWKVRYTNQIHTRYRNWRIISATQLQPSKSLCYIEYTSTWWQHDCWLTVQTLYTIYILTPERISQGHVQNGKRSTFSWPTLYNMRPTTDKKISLQLSQFLFWLRNALFWVRNEESSGNFIYMGPCIANRRCDLFSLLHFCRELYMFRVLTPIIRSWYSCN